MPDDNSCLFNAVGCVVKRVSDEATCNELRQGEEAVVRHFHGSLDLIFLTSSVVAKAIRSDPEEYNEAVLG